VTTVATIETTIGDLLDATVQRVPDGLALVDARDGTRRWTWAELQQEVADGARRIAATRRVGDVLAIWAPSEPAWVLLELACARAGVIVQPIDPALDVDGVGAALRRTGAKAVVVGAHDDLRLRAAAGLQRDLPALESVAVLGETASGPPARSLPTVTPATGALVLPTSGTTGAPKGALLSHRAVTADARHVADRMVLRVDDVWLTVMPLHRSGGCATTVLACLASGAAMICAPTWEPDDVVDLVRRERVTVFSAFPRALEALVDGLDRGGARLQPPTSVRLVQTGGAPVSPDLVRAVADRLGARLSVVYGLTEASPVLTQTDQRDPTDDPAASVGRPLPGTTIAVVDSRTREALAPGQVGEVVARGPQLMDGYVGNPEATARAIDEGGWLRTGDMGWLDGDERLHIEGRLDDVIERDGVRWLPGPVERAVVGTAAVGEAVVVGVVGANGSVEAVAFVRMREGMALDEDAVRAAIADACGAHRVPDRFVVLDEFPTLPSGKVRRFVLRDLADERPMTRLG
jgi:acyl-CoA synthetase (AMP-forming)/AMP-acid ligase II